MRCPVCGHKVRSPEDLITHQMKFHWKKIFDEQSKATKKMMKKK